LRLRHLLLLLLRAAAIALLALALARPSLESTSKLSDVLGSQESPVAAALVFDTAPHMQYRQKETRLEAARNSAAGCWSSCRARARSPCWTPAPCNGASTPTAG